MIAAARFALVGGAATVLHLVMGAVLIGGGVAPLLANLLAFLLAFFISFQGHFFYSFRGHGGSASVTLLRFAVVALVGFAMNETVLAGLLLIMPAYPIPALSLSTGIAAFWSFASSRLWAFRPLQASAM